MTETNIQLVIFDLGGVLIRLCDGWEHACELAGVTPSKTITDEDKQQLIRLVHVLEVGGYPEGEFYTLAAPLLGLDPAGVKAMSDAWLRGPFDGIVELIDAIHAAGRKTACLSNTNDNHWRVMTDLRHPNGLPLDRLHHRFASHLVRDRKPNPSIYHHVAQATATPPDAILFFDDAPENIAAASEQGWRACLIENPKDPVPQMTSHLKRHNLI